MAASMEHIVCCGLRHDTNTYSNAYSDTNTNTNTNTNTYSDTYSNTDADAYSNTNAYSNTDRRIAQARAHRLLAQLHQSSWCDISDQPSV